MVISRTKFHFRKYSTLKLKIAGLALVRTIPSLIK